MKIAMLHGPRDLRIEEHPLDTSPLKPNDIWIKTEISAFKIGTDRGNYEGAAQVPGAPDYPRGVGDSNLGIVQGVGSNVTRFQVGDRVVTRQPHQSETLMDQSESIVKVPEGSTRRTPSTPISMRSVPTVTKKPNSDLVRTSRLWELASSDWALLPWVPCSVAVWWLSPTVRAD